MPEVRAPAVRRRPVRAVRGRDGAVAPGAGWAPVSGGAGGAGTAPPRGPVAAACSAIPEDPPHSVHLVAAWLAETGGGTELEAADRLPLSRNTCNRALGRLVREGLAERDNTPKLGDARNGARYEPAGALEL